MNDAKRCASLAINVWLPCDEGGEISDAQFQKLKDVRAQVIAALSAVPDVYVQHWDIE